MPLRTSVTSSVIFYTKLQNGNAQNTTGLDFRRTFYLTKNIRNMLKNRFLYFREIWSLVFSEFLHKDGYSNAQNMTESSFWGKCFSAKNDGHIMRKYFFQVFIGFFIIFLYLSLKTSLIAMLMIKYDTIFNETDLFSWNFLKVVTEAF